MSAKATPDPARGARERHLLLAVDETDSSRRAVMFVADFFGDTREVVVTLLSILPEPSEDFFRGDAERLRWREEKVRGVEECLAGYRGILAGAGIAGGRVRTRVVVRQCASIGEAILEEQDRLACCIVVLGRRGVSHAEEFLFGSTSSRVLHDARRCAVLVVE